LKVGKGMRTILEKVVEIEVVGAVIKYGAEFL
jgi:hypothetical protein